MNYYTYHLERECPTCFEPIADQMHALRKYCPREVLEDGTIKSCKDDYHSPLRKLKKAPFKGFAVHHEMMRNRLQLLLRRHGEGVNIELINRYGIILARAAETEYTDEDSKIFYFVEYAVLETKNNQYKIIKHDRIF
jgi:hypothetical protein